MKTIQKKYVSALMAATLLFMTSCEDLWWEDRVEGNGHRVIEHRALEEFDAIEVNGNFEVRIDTGYASQATVEADENLLDLIVTHVSGDKLIIEERDGVNLDPSRRIEITVTTNADLHDVYLNGSGLIYNYGLSTDRLNINLSGSGRIECSNVEANVTEIDLEGSGIINCELYCENIITRLEGSGDIKLIGESVNSDHTITGSGKVKASQVITDVCVVHIAGSGIADIQVHSALEVTIIGSGIVYYTGDPNIDSYISGSGKIIER